MTITYGDAGVNISEGNRAVTLLKPLVRSTMRKEVLTDIGSFAGLFALDVKKYKEPVLVSGTDGVGTKLKIAMMAGKHDTIGIDAVAMCVNDILVQGAEPLFFLDYIAIGKLVPEKVADIVRGVSAGCIKAGCALIGGETAEMPGLYDIDEYDIAGFAVGVVDRDMLIDGGSIASGDIVIGIPSTGLHSNGFSLVRKLVCDEARIDINQYSERLGDTYADVLLTPTRIYVKELLPLAQKGLIKGMAHITGGGLTENIPRILPADLSVSLNPLSWAIPPIFTLLQEIGSIPDEEMRRVFNMGIGMVVIVSPEKTSAVIDFIPDALIIGKVVDGDSGVIYK